MKTLQGPAIFLAQFVGDEEPPLLVDRHPAREGECHPVRTGPRLHELHRGAGGGDDHHVGERGEVVRVVARLQSDDLNRKGPLFGPHGLGGRAPTTSRSW